MSRKRRKGGGAETVAESGTETETGSGTETGTESGTETGTESGTETGTESGTGTEAEPVSELALISPVRSMAAVSLTFLLFTQVLSRVGAVTLAALMPWAFPAQPDEETIVVPGTAGLVAMLLMTLGNATLAGLLAGRMANAMRRWHGVTLGAILGLFAAISMDAVRDFPGWFAIGWLVAPALGASLGGLLAERVAARAPKRLVSETVPPARRDS